MVAKRTKIRLGATDRLILWHVLRYGLTHKIVVHRCFLDTEKHKVEAARSRLRRLTDGGYLRFFSDPWSHFRLSPMGVSFLEAQLGLPQESLRPASRPFKSATVLLERCMILAHCCLAEHKRTVLLRHELEEWLQQYTTEGIRPWPYCVERDEGEAVLCLLIIDSGSSAKRQIARAAKQITRRLAIPGIRELERAGRFRATILTESKQRRDDISQSLDAAQNDSIVVFPVEHLSEIAPPLHLRGGL